MKIFIAWMAAALVTGGLAMDLESIYTEEELSEIDGSILEDARLDFSGLAKKYNYPCETHEVTTQDGYVLRLHRIPHGKGCQNKNVTRVPVLLQHGLLSHSIDWNIMGPGKGLGYILADECYDVWLGNSRGNRQSRKHTKLNIKQRKYWEFSWHEMGVSDLPTVIDYILDVTKQPSLHYIGHSQGTTQFFVFASLRPEYASKIRSAQMLSPVVFMKNLKSVLVRILMPFYKPFQVIADMFGFTELLPTSDLLKMLGSEVCTEKYPSLKGVCVNVLFLLCGYDIDQMNTTMIPAILGHTPAGASIRQLIHYAQNIKSGEFRQFDHGFFGNLFRYGSITPPSYPLHNVRVPVALYFSDNDWLADPNDVHKLSDILPNVIGKFRVPRKQFNHLGYIWATDGRSLLYDRVLSIMKRY